MRLPPTSAPSETSWLSHLSPVFVQVEDRKTAASRLPPAGTEVSEEEELQQAEEVGGVEPPQGAVMPPEHV